MLRLLFAVLALVFAPAMGPAPNIAGLDWHLLAIDGSVTTSRATLRIEGDGTMAGAAPCNRWSTTNAASLPALQIGGIRATRMACDKLSDETAFFDALSAMTTLKLDGDRNLVLRGPDGRSMEFVLDVMNSLTTCKTCRTEAEAGKASP